MYMSVNVPYRCVWIFPPIFDTVTFWCCDFTDRANALSVGGAGGSRGRELCRRHIWAHHRLCIAIGCGPYAAACQQDGLPPPAVLTLIILVSPRTYRKSLCHFKIDSGRGTAQSPNKAYRQPDFVQITDRHTRLDISHHYTRLITESSCWLMSMLASQWASLATWTRIVNSCYLHLTGQTGLIRAKYSEETLVIEFARLCVEITLLR